MLTPDQAKEMLKEAQIEHERERRLAALEGLPETLATPGRLLFSSNKEDQAADWQTRLQRTGQAVGLLDALPVSDRVHFFETLFPGLGPTVERAWQIQTIRLP